MVVPYALLSFLRKVAKKVNKPSFKKYRRANKSIGLRYNFSFWK
jgi:hypothetical protein